MDFFMQYLTELVSILTISTCLLIKVPQIMYLKKTRSAKGIFLHSLIMEFLGYTIMSLYNIVNNYSITSYLEYPIILVQMYFLLYYTLKYKRLLHYKIVPIAVIAYFTSVVCFVMRILPEVLLHFLVPFCSPLSGFAKITYMYGIISTHSAENVSIVTWTISTLTNLSRLFTVYMQSNDIKLMVNFFVSAILSGAVLCTSFFYKYLYVAGPQPAVRVMSPASRRRVELR